MPLRLRKQFQNILNLRGKNRRSDGTSQNAHSCAIHGFLRCREALRLFLEHRPSPNITGIRRRFRAVWIVQIENRSLRKRIRRAKARWMIGIAFNFRRAPFVAFHENADRIGTEGHHRRILLRLAQNQSIGLFDIWNDVLFGSSAATSHSGQRHRSSHQLQEVAAVNGFIPFGGSARKFTMQQILKVRIAGKFFNRTPVLLARAAFRLGVGRGQIQRIFAHFALSRGRRVIVRVFRVCTYKP